jgi:hypothetical protein
VNDLSNREPLKQKVMAMLDRASPNLRA